MKAAFLLFVLFVFSVTAVQAISPGDTCATSHPVFGYLDEGVFDLVVGMYLQGRELQNSPDATREKVHRFLINWHLPAGDVIVLEPGTELKIQAIEDVEIESKVFKAIKIRVTRVGNRRPLWVFSNVIQCD